MLTIREKYDRAMWIEDADTANAYFEACVQHTMAYGGRTREQAIGIERQNLGYYAGYFDRATRARVERLFLCAHLVLP